MSQGEDHPDATMQVDALVDDMEDLGEGAHGVSRPPPLPPKKPSKVMWVVGLLVVLLATGLGLGAGAFLLGGDSETVEPARPPQEEPARSPEPADERTAAPTVAEPSERASDEEPPSPNVVEMDDFVFGAPEEPAPAP